jgi:hypothetical protein
MTSFITHIDQLEGKTQTNQFELNGTKSFVANARFGSTAVNCFILLLCRQADLFLVWAHLNQSEIDPNDSNKILSVLIVERTKENANKILITDRTGAVGLPGVECKCNLYS